MSKILKTITKKQIAKLWNLEKNLDFTYLYFEKRSRIFQNLLIKCLIHPIKHHKNSITF